MAKKKSTVKNEEILEIQDTENVINVEDIKVDVDEIKESIDSVDTTIEVNNAIIELEEKIKEEMKPINEIEEKINQLSSSKETLEKILSENPEQAQSFIMKEIEKAESLKSEVEKIINSTKVDKSNIKMTSWWNGIGYNM